MSGSKGDRRKERIDRGIKVRSDSVYAISSWKEITYLIAPRLVLILGLALAPLAFERSAILATRRLNYLCIFFTRDRVRFSCQLCRAGIIRRRLLCRGRGLCCSPIKHVFRVASDNYNPDGHSVGSNNLHGPFSPLFTPERGLFRHSEPYVSTACSANY